MFQRFVPATAAALAALALTSTPARAEPALWVVTDADSAIYLFGTVHLLRPDLAWRTPRLDRALGACADLTLEIVEADGAAEAPALIRAQGFDPARPLSARLGPADNARLAQAAATLGLAPAQMDTMRPWLAAVTLSIAPLLRAGYDPNAGVERLLTADARARGRPVLALETPGQQIRMLAGLSEPDQLAFLRDALEDYEDAPVELDRLAVAWAAGKTAEIDRIVNEEIRRDAPRLYKVILADRNVAFARQIKAMLDDSAGPRCVAVGAGHLAGDDSVQAKLKALGVESKRY